MSIADTIPGMKPGSTGRNVVVGLIYGIIGLITAPLLLPLVVLISPVVAAVAVGKNYRGAADKLSGLPGIDPSAGLQSGVVAFVGVVLLLAVVGAVAPADDSEATESAATPTPEAQEQAQTAAETEAQEQTEAQTSAPGTETEAPETETPEPEPTPEPETETPAPEPEPETEESSGDGYQVRISYDGEWQGALGGDASTRSVDGSGTETFDIKGDPFVVSANAQKMDSGSGELTVQILNDGEVVSEQSTTAEYGVASTSN